MFWPVPWALREVRLVNLLRQVTQDIQCLKGKTLVTDRLQTVNKNYTKLPTLKQSRQTEIHGSRILLKILEAKPPKT